MPHILIEYSKTLGEIIDSPALVLSLHETLAAQGVNKSAIRTRSRMCRYAAVGEQDLHGHMIHVTLALKAGRDKDTKHRYAEALFGVLKEHVTEKVKACAISMEIRDMDADMYYTT
ncbi:MAG: 5-carboxymethyl-2-hydroxymuconate Delta-isomerase [Alphaproteobacteria bacterium]